MASALKEIGIKKALKFGYISILMIFYRMIIFPQLRVLYLRLLGAKIGKNVIMHNARFFNYYRLGFKGVKIGDNCFIGDESLIDLTEKIVIADHVTIAQRVTILTHTNVGYKDHPLQKYFPSIAKPVIFERGSFIGANVTILPGTKIGECTFIAAGSIVTKDIPRYCLAAGVPAKVIRELNIED